MRRIGFHAMLLGGMALVSAAAPAVARDYFVTPDGAGAMDGSGWSAAMSQDALPDLLARTVEPGDRIVLGSGQYARRPKAASMLAIARGGAAERPVTSPVFDTVAIRSSLERHVTVRPDSTFPAPSRTVAVSCTR